MERVVTAEEMRRAEQRVFDAEPGVDLMGRAARAVAEAAAELVPVGPVLVVVGPGNNGGDGLFAAALLADSRDVAIWLTSGRGHEAGLAAARAAGVGEVDAAGAIRAAPDAALVIDAVLGIGGRPGLPADVAAFAGACERLGVPVLSVDIPSGLDADSGKLPAASFHATVTVTFAARKPCHVTAPASGRCGRIVVADIGVPV